MDCGCHYLGLTQGQKAEYVTRYHRTHYFSLVRNHDIQTAAEQAAATAGSDFPETP